MKQDVLVSIIVPVYNVEEYLGRCVDSILGQTYKNLEVILVDDGATDSSGQICDGYAQRDSRVKVIHKENGGLSSARNAGIDVAAGAFLEFVDSDDWIEPDAVENLLQQALAHQVELVVGGRWDVRAETGEKTQGLCPVKNEVISGQELVGRIFLWDNCDSSACDKLFARRLFRQIRFPLGKVCEDVPIMYLIVLDAGRVAMLDRPIYNYFHRRGSITTTKTISEKTFHFSEHTADVLSYIQKNCPEIEPQARYLRIRSLVHALLLADLADRESTRPFREKIRSYRRELGRLLRFMMMSSYFTKQEKATAVLLSADLYIPVRGLYHKVR